MEEGSALRRVLSDGVIRPLTRVGVEHPELHQMFGLAARDAHPPPQLEPWSGGYAGIHLAAAAAVFSVQPDAALKNSADSAVQQLLSHRLPHGYIGPWPSKFEFTRDAPNAETPWDIWGHAHIVIGATLWHKASGSHFALDLAVSVGDMLLRKFGEKPADIHSLGAQHTSGVLATAFATLYELTDADKYLEGIRTTLKFIDMPGAGGFQTMHKKKVPFDKGTCKNWEALLTLNAFTLIGCVASRSLPESGEVAAAFWWELCETRRAVNGGMTLADQSKAFLSASDNPRTLATYGWVRLTTSMLRLRAGAPDECAVADELELCVVNAARLAVSVPTECCDELPLDGEVDRRPARLDHSTLCGLDMLGAALTHAFVTEENVLTLHLYHAGVHTATLPSGNKIRLTVDTQYPHDRLVRVIVQPQRRGEQFCVRLRVPGWAVGATAEVDMVMAGQPERHEPAAGSYLVLDKTWSAGDAITLDLNLGVRFRKAVGNDTSNILLGPFLLAARTTSSFSIESSSFIVSRVSTKNGEVETILKAIKGGDVVAELRPYAFVAAENKTVATSFKLSFKGGIPNVPFSRTNPLCSFSNPDVDVQEEEDQSSDGRAVAAPIIAIAEARGSARGGKPVFPVKASKTKNTPAPAPYNAAPPYTPRSSLPSGDDSTPAGLSEDQLEALQVELAGAAASVQPVARNDQANSLAKRRASVPELLQLHERRVSQSTTQPTAPAPTASSPPPAQSPVSKKSNSSVAAAVAAAVASASAAVTAAEATTPKTTPNSNAKTNSGRRSTVASPEELAELEEARAMQQSLRKTKADMESKAASVQTTPGTSPSKGSSNITIAPGPATPRDENTCVVCVKKVYPMEKLTADGIVYHKTCFRCATCNKMIGLGNYAALEGHLYCKPCFKKMFKLKGNYSEGFGKEQHKMKWLRTNSGGMEMEDSATGTAPALNRRRSTQRMLSETLAANEGDGYTIASGEEVDATQPETSTTPDDSEQQWKEIPNALQPKSSWKQSWKKLLGKNSKKTDGAKKKKEKVQEGAKKVPFTSGGMRARTETVWKPPAADKCVACTKTVYPMEKLQADGSVYHKSCFRCAECTKIVGLGNYAALEGKLYCKPCFKKMFKLKGNYSEGFGKEQHKMKWLRTSEQNADDDMGETK